jgi:flagellin
VRKWVALTKRRRQPADLILATDHIGGQASGALYGRPLHHMEQTMAFTIRTNIMALNAQRFLNTTQSRMAVSMQRLTSGMRINSAKDDAAGMAIATRLSTQINGMAQAKRNASDGISLAQTSESALDEVTSNLQRMRELALQAANGHNSPNDRKALNEEVKERVAEITRVAAQTNFNGLKVLDGSGAVMKFQVGANVGEVIEMTSGRGTRADQMGQIASGRVDLTKFFVGSPYSGTQAPSTDWTATNAQKLGSVQYDGNTVDWSKYNGANVNDAQAYLSSALGSNYSVSVNGNDLSIQKVGGSRPTLSKGDLSFQTATGEQVDIAGSFASAGEVVQTINAHARSGISAFVAEDGSLAFHARSDFDVVGKQASKLGFSPNYAVDAGSTLADGNVLNIDAAFALISRIDAAMDVVSEVRSGLGAVQNRLDSTIRNLDSGMMNLKESRSAITDADIGEETSNKAMAQILEQSGVAMLAQANMSKQLVLKLLEG